MLSLNLASVRPQVQSDVPFHFEAAALPLLPAGYHFVDGHFSCCPIRDANAWPYERALGGAV